MQRMCNLEKMAKDSIPYCVVNLDDPWRNVHKGVTVHEQNTD